MNHIIYYTKKDPLSSENYDLLKGFFHLKYATNVTSPKLVTVKWVTSRSIYQDLIL